MHTVDHERVFMSLYEKQSNALLADLDNFNLDEYNRLLKLRTSLHASSLKSNKDNQIATECTCCKRDKNLEVID